MDNLAWSTVQRKVNDLIPYEKNPRKISKTEKKKLEESLVKFNLVDIPVIDHDEVLISGHQRCKVLIAIGRGEEVIDVRYPNRKLTEEEFKELNLRSNINNGDWVGEILKDEFEGFDLEEIGFSEFELEDMIEKEVQSPVENKSGNVKTETLKPFNKSHILISFPPEKLIDIQVLMNSIDSDEIEIELSSN